MSLKISEMDPADALTGTELVEVVQDGMNVQTTTQAIADLADGGLGGSTESTDNAVLRANGTGGATVQASAMIVDDTANIALGVAATAGSSRNINAIGSASDIDINLISKGAGAVQLTSGTSIIQANSGGGNSLISSTGNAVRRNSAATNTVSVALEVDHVTSGTPVAGFGTALNIKVQSDVGVALEAVYTDPTSLSEDVDFLIKTMSGGSNSEKLRITSDGRIYGTALHNNAGSLTGTTNQYIASGTYTPTLSNTTNVSSSTAFECQWIRVGNVVTVSGMVGITATGAGNTVLRMTLPIPSDFSQLYHCAGVHNQSSGTENAGVIYAGIGTDTAEFNHTAVSTSALNRLFSFTYQII
jgi:hypothetical protein